MSEPTKILVCLLTMCERGGWVHPDLNQWVADLPYSADGYAYKVTRAHNFIPAASARNTFCKENIDADVDWLLMIDNDMGPAADLFSTIKNVPKDADVVVPVFYMWDENNLRLKLCWGAEIDGDKTRVVNGQEQFRLEPGFHRLTKCGSGAIFIRPRILKKIAYPYFQYEYNAHGGMSSTEDIDFSRKVLDAGGKIYGNGSVVVEHYHTVGLCKLSMLLDNARQEGLLSRQGEASPAEPVAAASPAHD